MLALRAPRRATRLAVNAGGLDRADDATVPAPVAALERRPGAVLVDARPVAHDCRSRTFEHLRKAGHGSVPRDLGGKAATGGVVGVDRLDPGGVEQPANPRV